MKEMWDARFWDFKKIAVINKISLNKVLLDIVISRMCKVKSFTNDRKFIVLNTWGKINFPLTFWIYVGHLEIWTILGLEGKFLSFY